jgi:acetyl esterase
MAITEALTRFVVRFLCSLPNVIQQLIAGKPTEIDGQRLYTEVQMALRLLNAMPDNDFTQLPLAEARTHLDAEARIFGGYLPVKHVEDTTIPTRDGSVPARVYQHHNESMATVVYFHGGEWVLGSLDSTDSVCRFIAHHLNVVVVSVAYRLAPEHPFPAGLNDAIDAYRHVRAHKEWGHVVAVAGDSAGGNLSAVIANETRDDPPDAQLLFFPATDLASESTSYKLFADGFFLTAAHVRWYIERYATPEQRKDPRVSPLFADLGDGTNIAPALVWVASFDVLRDEGVAYAEKLKKLGVPTTLKVVTGHIHAFTNATGVGNEGKKALHEAVEALRGLLEKARAEREVAAQ